jgi:hypothetical protein
VSGYRALVGIIASAVGLLVLLALSRLELYPRIRYVSESREVRENPFYALEKWLGASGYPARSERLTPSLRDPAGFLRKLGGREGAVFLESSLFYWDEAEESLLPWLREGGSLILSLNPSWDAEIDGELLGFLGGLGIAVEDEMRLDDAAGDAGPDSLFHWRLRFGPVGESLVRESLSGESPASRPVFIQDSAGLGRIAEVSLGKGSLTVMGLPLFMYNNSLKEEEAARLAWDLTAGKVSAERPEILFVRAGRQVKSLTGRLLERGNLIPPLAAAMVLILTGFWMLIPSFGIPRRETPDSGLRSIRERFRAEAQFLKKHRALDLYLEAYVREIEYRCRTRGREAAELLGPVKAELASGMTSKKKLNYHAAIRRLESLMDVLERL